MEYWRNGDLHSRAAKVCFAGAGQAKDGEQEVPNLETIRRIDAAFRAWKKDDLCH